MLGLVTGRAAATPRLALACLVATALLAACTGPRAPRVVADPSTWAARAGRGMNGTTLASAGVDVPAGANVLAARIFDGGDSPAYVFFQAGGGAFSDRFYPASSVKLLAALGALDYARALGFTGGALIDGGYSIRDTYDAALRWSSNQDYDELVRIAGVDRLNRRFLPGHGFPATVIQEPYGSEDEGEQVSYSPEMTLSEDGRQVDVPARESAGDYGCDGGNCASLFDMSDALRRVVLDAEIPAGERFDLDPADIAGLQDALLGAESWVAPGVADALGAQAVIYDKPGYVPGLDCVDTSIVADPATGHRFLLALSSPDDDGCDALPAMARHILTLLDGCNSGTAMRSDGSLVAVVDGHQTAAPVVDPVPVACASH